MHLTNIIKPIEREFLTLCRLHKVRKLYAFGSAVTDQFDGNRSDIDLVVEIDEKDPLKKGDLLLDFYEALQSFFKRKVDLVTDQPVTNPYFREELERNKVLIYDGKRKKVLI